VLARTLTLKPKDRKPPVLGPKVRVETARISPPADESGLSAVINGAGLYQVGKNGLKEHGANPRGMWLGTWTTSLNLEFELPEAAPLSAIEVWNFNAPWQTTNGIRKVDVAVSADGTNWQTILRGAEIAEAEGTAGYDEPTVLKFNGVTARKVRFENIVPWSTSGKVGLSAVVFHEAASTKAGPLQPEDGSTSVGIAKPALEWTPGRGATEHRVYFGSSRDTLAPLGTTKEVRMALPELNPNTVYFWRVDEVQPDGSVVPGRIARFTTSGLVAWWKLDETDGAEAADAAGHHLVGHIEGQPRWTARRDNDGGALEFDGQENFINCGNATAFDFRGAMTLSVWMKVRKFDKNWQAIVTKGDHAWRLQRNNTSNTIVFYPAGLNSSQGAGEHRPRLFTKRAMDDNQWHHVVGLCDGQRSALYVDGQLEDSVAATGLLFQDTEPVMIGENSMHRGRLFNGWMNDVRLYGYGLSAEEVRALYSRGREGKRADK
jgi:hypothetical protein